MRVSASAPSNATVLQWTFPDAVDGEVFRLGSDVAHRDAPLTLRIETMTTPDSDYRDAVLEALLQLSDRWGGRLELVLDFVGHGPPGPGESLSLCRALSSAGTVRRIVLLQKPWMPAFLLSAVRRVLKAATLEIEIRKESA